MPPEGKETQPPVCDYEGSDYQTSFWEQGGRAYEDAAEQIALKRLLPDRGELLLEIGAGAGRNTPRYQGYDRIVLLDFSRTQLQQAQARLGRGGRYIYVAADVYKMPFVEGLFDGATMIRTLHHMADAPRALKEVRYTLQPGAVFLLEYANKRNLKAILRYLIRRQNWNPFTREPVEFEKLNFDFHPKAVRAWLKAVGFAVERQLTVSHFRVGLIKRLVPAKLLALLDGLLQPTGAWWQYTPSVFVKAEAVGDTPIAPDGAFFRCPDCGHGLDEHPKEGHDFLACGGCGRKWPVRDGIYDFKEPL
ncbi:MAG: class I SAM-dependent methyltransferase [Anaerolineae bacterium]|nr:class I SAM-dependent methyltransferase [Anaerolineae bacterium]